MADTRDPQDQQPTEVSDADRSLDTLFSEDGPDAATEARLWNRVQSNLGPQAPASSGWLAGLFGGFLGIPARRAAMAGGAAAVIAGAVLVAPAFTGDSASAAILEEIDDLSVATAAALDDDDLSEDELAELRSQVEALLARLADDPNLLEELDLDDLAEATATLQLVETKLITRPTVTTSGDVASHVGQIALPFELELRAQAPDSPLLAISFGDDNGSLTILDSPEGRHELSIGEAGSVVVEIEGDSISLVGLRPGEGWTAVPDEIDDDEIEIDFEGPDGQEIEVELELDDDAFPSISIKSEGVSTDADDDDGRDDDEDDSPATATAIPSATATPDAGDDASSDDLDDDDSDSDDDEVDDLDDDSSDDDPDDDSDDDDDNG